MLTFPQRPLALNLSACPDAWVRVKVTPAHVCEDQSNPSPTLTSRLRMPTLGEPGSARHYQTHPTGEGQKARQSKWPDEENRAEMWPGEGGDLGPSEGSEPTSGKAVGCGGWQGPRHRDACCFRAAQQPTFL